MSLRGLRSSCGSRRAAYLPWAWDSPPHPWLHAHPLRVRAGRAGLLRVQRAWQCPAGGCGGPGGAGQAGQGWPVGSGRRRRAPAHLSGASRPGTVGLWRYKREIDWGWRQTGTLHQVVGTSESRLSC